MNARVLTEVSELENIQAPGPDGVLGGESPESLDQAVRRAVLEAQGDDGDDIPQGQVVIECYRSGLKPGERGTDEEDPTADPDDLRG